MLHLRSAAETPVRSGLDGGDEPSMTDIIAAHRECLELVKALVLSHSVLAAVLLLTIAVGVDLLDTGLHPKNWIPTPLSQLSGRTKIPGASQLLTLPEDLGQGGRDEDRIGNWGEGNEDDAVGEVVTESRSDVKRQPSLAHPAGSGEGDKTDVRTPEQFSDS